MHFYRCVCPALFIGAAMAMTSCVDNDYDLTKDIDLTVNVGGDLTLPASSTERYTVAQILDLGENSSIKPDGELYGLASGDYVLVQGGDPTNSSVSVPRQSLNEVSCNSSSAAIPFVSAGAGTSVDYTLKAFSNDVSIADADIDPAVTSLKSARTDIVMNFSIAASVSGGIGGNVTFKPGFAIEFPASWTVEVADPSVLSYARIQANKLVFTATHALSFNSTLLLPVRITAVDLTSVPAGQGLYEPGKFRLVDKIVSSGPMSFTPSSAAAGQSVNVQFEIAPVIPSASILEITGSINPDIKIDPTSFAINDVPEFLKEPGNNLDIYNPQVHLSVNNASPVEVDVNCHIVAIDENGNRKDLWIGDEHGTAPIMIGASGITDICISRTGKGGPSGAINVEVPGLSEILETIPQSITIDNISARVPANRTYTFELGQNYGLTIDYKAVAPLAFGSGLQFVYTTDEKGWDEDLHKYSFRQAIATIDVENSVPLEMTPTVVALDRNGNEISDITATVEGSVAAGTVSIPSTTSLKVTLKSDAANIGNLDGVWFSFRATCPYGMVSTPLNVNQALRFTNIRVKLVGGVGVDLN